jgi:hypothetical protein
MKRLRADAQSSGDSMISYAEDCQTINPIEPEQREWALFFIFGLVEHEEDFEDADDRGSFLEWWDQHLDWIMARAESPDAWLGAEGDDYRANYDGWNNPGREFVQRWHRFQAAHAADTLAEIDRLLGTLLFDA